MTGTRTSGAIHVPQMRWGGRWHADLDSIPQDGQWHFLARYSRTSGYQIARSLQTGRKICSLPWEFGAKTLDTHSEVWVRWHPQAEPEPEPPTPV
jgi:hypothetical protein